VPTNVYFPENKLLTFENQRFNTTSLIQNQLDKLGNCAECALCIHSWLAIWTNGSEDE